MMKKSSSSWLEIVHPRPQADLRLFCFPYAGGGAAIYRLWAEELPSFVEVCPVELPGRGRRFGEPLFEGLDDLLAQALDSLEPEMDRPFAFFGHSMGALIAFEMARFLRQRKGFQPRMLFLSAHGAPQNLKLRPNPLFKLPDGELLKELERLGGTPQEVLAHRELIQLFLPTLRADLKILETYVYRPEEPLGMPFIVLGGTNDAEVPPQALDGWRDLTRSDFSQHLFPGDHFFLKSAGDEFFKVISGKMEAWNLR